MCHTSINGHSTRNSLKELLSDIVLLPRNVLVKTFHNHEEPSGNQWQYTTWMDPHVRTATWCLGWRLQTPICHLPRPGVPDDEDWCELKCSNTFKGSRIERLQCTVAWRIDSHSQRWAACQTLKLSRKPSYGKRRSDFQISKISGKGSCC